VAKHVLQLMDAKGHTEVQWSEVETEHKEEGYVSVEEAKAIFDKHLALGYFAYAVAPTLTKSGERKGTQLREFDPQAERIVMAVPMAGG